MKPSEKHVMLSIYRPLEAAMSVVSWKGANESTL
jgi:hypothetical protein